VKFEEFSFFSPSQEEVWIVVGIAGDRDFIPELLISHMLGEI